MIGFKVTDKKQADSKLFLKFGDEPIAEAKFNIDMSKNPRVWYGDIYDALREFSKKNARNMGKKRAKELKDIEIKMNVFRGKLMMNFDESVEVIKEEDAAVRAAKLKADQVEEMEALKRKQVEEMDAMKERHERENEKIALDKEKEAANKAIDAERESARKAAQNEERNYKKEYENYHGKKEQIARRSKRNEARRSLKGQKKLTADKDVHHKDNNPMNNDKSNLSIVTQKYNRTEPRLREGIDSDAMIDLMQKYLNTKNKNEKKTLLKQINKYQKKLGLKVTEALGKNATQDDYIKDFLDSDAPQFKGKTKDKIIQMAVAAFKDRQNG